MNKKVNKTKENVKRIIGIKKFLITNADTIQKLATQKHKKLLNNTLFRSEFIDKYQKNHIKLVKFFAENLDHKEINERTDLFKKMGETIAKDSVKDGLNIEEAVDGIIFLKQAVIETLYKENELRKLDRDETYQISQAIGTYCDIVASKLTFTYQAYHDKQIKEETDKRERIQKQKDDFLNEVSHELKTPMTSIKAYAQILAKRRAEDKMNIYFLTQIDAQATKVVGLLNDLLDAGKMEAGKLTFDKKSTDLNKIIKKIVVDFQYTTETHEIIFEGVIDKKIRVDADKIEQVIINLLTNAIKYSPKSTKIIVHISNTASEAKISVQNSGIGIPKSKQKNLFTRFYRVNEKGEAKHTGIGLGLYICAEIIKRHGGLIWVDSKQTKTKGAIFYFTLPY